MKDLDFIEWNELMFKRYRNERLYNHPNPIIRYTENKRVRLIIDMASVEDKDNVLDIGCGEGYVIGKIENCEIIGIDISETALSLANDKLKDREDVDLIRGNVERMPFRDDSFDKMICTEVLEHVPYPDKVIKEIMPLLKQDGKIIITIPNEDLINSVKKFFLKLRLFDLFLKDVPHEMNKEWHLHMFNLDCLKELIKDDLDIIDIKAVPFSILPIRYVVSCIKKNSSIYNIKSKG